jgi:hypothetical protein
MPRVNLHPRTATQRKVDLGANDRYGRPRLTSNGLPTVCPQVRECWDCVRAPFLWRELEATRSRRIQRPMNQEMVAYRRQLPTVSTKIHPEEKNSSPSKSLEHTPSNSKNSPPRSDSSVSDSPSSSTSDSSVSDSSSITSDDSSPDFSNIGSGLDPRYSLWLQDLRRYCNSPTRPASNGSSTSSSSPDSSGSSTSSSSPDAADGPKNNYKFYTVTREPRTPLVRKVVIFRTLEVNTTRVCAPMKKENIPPKTSGTEQAKITPADSSGLSARSPKSIQSAQNMIRGGAEASPPRRHLGDQSNSPSTEKHPSPKMAF